MKGDLHPLAIEIVLDNDDTDTSELRLDIERFLGDCERITMTERPASQMYEYRIELEYLKDCMRMIIKNIDLLEGKKDATTIPM